MERLQNGLQFHSRLEWLYFFPLTLLLASSQWWLCIDADAWCKGALNCPVIVFGTILTILETSDTRVRHRNMWTWPKHKEQALKIQMRDSLQTHVHETSGGTVQQQTNHLTITSVKSTQNTSSIVHLKMTLKSFEMSHDMWHYADALIQDLGITRTKF